MKIGEDAPNGASLVRATVTIRVAPCETTKRLGIPPLAGGQSSPQQSSKGPFTLRVIEGFEAAFPRTEV